MKGFLSWSGVTSQCLYDRGKPISENKRSFNLKTCVIERFLFGVYAFFVQCLFGGGGSFG